MKSLSFDKFDRKRSARTHPLLITNHITTTNHKQRAAYCRQNQKVSPGEFNAPDIMFGIVYMSRQGQKH